MTDQLALINRERPLTDRQQFALDQITQHQPIPSDALGALWCAHRGKHTADSRCQWDTTTGRELGRSLRRRGLAIERRKLGGWCTPEYRPTHADTGSQNAAGPGLDDRGFPEGF